MRVWGMVRGLQQFLKYNQLMKTSILSGIAFSAFFALQACNSGTSDNDDRDSASVHGDTTGIQNGNSSTPANAPLGGTDTSVQSFITQAAVAGIMEVEAGKLAQEKANKAAIKAFGGKMVQDHTKANEELKGLASSKGVTVPATLPAAEQSHLDAMKQLSGAAFDKHYMEMMVNDHGKVISLFEQASMSPVAEVKSWAEKTLPVLKSHNEMANKLYAEIK